MSVPHEPPPLNHVQLNKTRDNLRLLGIFYILFGLAALPGLLLIGFKNVMIEEAVKTAESVAGVRLEVDLELILQILTWGIVAVIIVHVLTFVWIGFAFRNQKNYISCFVAAIFCCLSFPLGTILGIFSLMNLNSPEGKKLFGRSS